MLVLLAAGKADASISPQDLVDKWGHELRTALSLSCKLELASPQVGDRCFDSIATA